MSSEESRPELEYSEFRGPRPKETLRRESICGDVQTGKCAGQQEMCKCLFSHPALYPCTCRCRLPRIQSNVSSCNRTSRSSRSFRNAAHWEDKMTGTCSRLPARISA